MHREHGQPPVLCLITARHRLVTGVGARATDWQALLLDQIAGAIAGGVDVVQIREGDLDAGILVRFVRTCLEVASRSAARIVVNDRLDVALAAGADGVHLREDGMPVAAARRLAGRPFVVGRSIHHPNAAASGALADYLIAGSVFETRSKPGARGRLGLDGFAQVVAAAGSCPVWAVGGITAARIPALVERGARGIAAVDAFIPPTSASELATAVQRMTENLRYCFDTPSGLP